MCDLAYLGAPIQIPDMDNSITRKYTLVNLIMVKKNFSGIVGYKDKPLISIIFYCVKKFIVIEISGLVRIGLVRWVICFIRY